MITFSCEDINENTLCYRFHTNDSSNALTLPPIIAHCKDVLCHHFELHIVDTICAYNTLVIIYNMVSIEHKQLTRLANQFIQQTLNTAQNHTIQNSSIQKNKLDSVIDNINHTTKNTTTHYVPTYYGPECGWDLQRIAELNQCSMDYIIQQHTTTPYTVCAMGFAPGFAYCGFVDETISCPRLDTPRQNVPAGSVGIADNQTGIYPTASPGGWNIIGRTLFTTLQKEKVRGRVDRDVTSAINVGDIMIFHAISRDVFMSEGSKL